MFEVFFETPQPWPLQQKFLLHIKSWIWMNLCHKKSSSMNFVPGFSQQKYPPSIQSSNISNLSIKYTLLDYCASLCSAHNCKSYGNATSHLRVPCLTRFFLKEITRIPQFNTVFIRKKIFPPETTFFQLTPPNSEIICG